MTQSNDDLTLGMADLGTGLWSINMQIQRMTETISDKAMSAGQKVLTLEGELKCLAWQLNAVGRELNLVRDGANPIWGG